MASKRTSGKSKMPIFTGKAELVATVVAACLYAALVMYLVALAVFSHPDQARFEITVAEPRREGNAVYLEVEVINRGTRSVAELHVGLSENRGMAREIIFDYLPAGSRRRGTIMLPADTAPQDPAIAVISYRDP